MIQIVAIGGVPCKVVELMPGRAPSKNGVFGLDLGFNCTQTARLDGRSVSLHRCTCVHAPGKTTFVKFSRLAGSAFGGLNRPRYNSRIEQEGSNPTEHAPKLRF